MSTLTAPNVFRALGHPVRHELVARLSQAATPTSVTDLTKGLELTQPTISHHLKILSEAGITRSRKDGRWRLYTLTSPARALLADADHHVDQITAGA